MIPKRLKDARIAAGLSQEQLAQLVGVDEGVNCRSRLSSYEVGRTEPPFSFVVKLAKVLNCPEYYFYTIDDAVAKQQLESFQKEYNEIEFKLLNEINEIKSLLMRLNERL